jgi:hypothetical protein
MKLKSKLAIAGMIAGLVLSGASSASVYVNSNRTMIQGTPGVGANYNDPNGYLDVVTTGYYSTYGTTSNWIYVSGRSPSGLSFNCHVTNTDPHYQTMLDAVQSVNEASNVLAVSYYSNPSKCGSINVRN